MFDKKKIAPNIMKSHKGFIYVQDFETAYKVSLADGFRSPTMESHLVAIQKEGTIDLTYLTMVAKNALFFMSEDRHLDLRNKVLKHIGPAKMNHWEHIIDTFINEQIEQIKDCESIDVITEFTYPIYRKVTQRLLGIHPSNPETFEYWVTRLQELLEPLLPLRVLRQMEGAFEDLILQLKEGLASKDTENEQPVSLLTELLNWESPHFNDDDIIAAVLVLYGASINVSQTLANIVYHLLNAPDEIREQASDPHWIKSNLEYLIKIGASPKYVHRIATKEQNFGVHCISEKDNVLLDLPAIHSGGCPFHNTSKWEDKLTEKKMHLAFGQGIHYCVGAGYSRFIIRKAIPVLFAKFKKMQLKSTTPDLGNLSQAISLKTLYVTLKK